MTVVTISRDSSDSSDNSHSELDRDRKGGQRGSLKKEVGVTGSEKKRDRHLRKFCPLVGCNAGPQSRLAWHIKTAHPHVSTTRRMMMTKGAQVVKKQRPKPQCNCM